MRQLFAAGIISLLASISGMHVDADTNTHHHGNVSIESDSDDDGVSTCDDVTVRFDHQKAARESVELPVGSLTSLKVVSDSHGGIRVAGWDEPRYAVTACKAAAIAGDLRDVNVTLTGNEVHASGPDDGQWVVVFLVHAPRNAVLDLATDNGPISVRDVTGTVNAHALNGPIAVKRSNGTIDVTTTNGPIAYSGSSGSVKLSATNGPLAVKLLGSHWDGSLDSHTENGPLSIRLPSGFGSKVTVTSNGHGPIACKAVACRDARRAMAAADDDDEPRGPRTMTFGSGAGNVTLSTVNGPIAVKESED